MNRKGCLVGRLGSCCLRVVCTSSKGRMAVVAGLGWNSDLSHEIGFVANISLAVGATIFYISGILVLPGVTVI